jgi:hypothetical protein
LFLALRRYINISLQIEHVIEKSQSSRSGSGSLQIMTDPNPNPTGPKTYGAMNPAPEHCWKHCLGLEDSDGVLNMVKDKVEGCHPLHVPDGEGGTLLYRKVNNLNHDILFWIRIRILLFFIGFQKRCKKQFFCLFVI